MRKGGLIGLAAMAIGLGGSPWSSWSSWSSQGRKREATLMSWYHPSWPASGIIICVIKQKLISRCTVEDLFDLLKSPLAMRTAESGTTPVSPSTMSSRWSSKSKHCCYLAPQKETCGQKMFNTCKKYFELFEHLAKSQILDLKSFFLKWPEKDSRQTIFCWKFQKYG